MQNADAYRCTQDPSTVMKSIWNRRWDALPRLKLIPHRRQVVLHHLTCRQVCVHVRMCTCTYTYVRMFTYIYIYIFFRVWLYIQMYVCKPGLRSQMPILGLVRASIGDGWTRPFASLDFSTAPRTFSQNKTAGAKSSATLRTPSV